MYPNNRVRLVGFSIMVFSLLSACVSTGKYDQAVAERDAFKKAYGELQVIMADQIAADQAKLTELIDGVEIEIPSDVLFASGAATPTVTEESKDDLRAVAAYLKSNPNFFISIVGHTDSQRPSARLAERYPTNWEMGAARASVAARFLQQQGVDPRRIEAVSRSQYKPAATNDTSDGRAQNRRVQIILRSLPPDF